ncbi:MAG: lysophospholipase, partial [Blautia sp.]|nr:lysophospholipase [Blautia sp.]
NERVQRLAKDYGATYLDLNQDLTDEKGNLKKELTVEGMHMYANGYRLVFERLLPTLKSL